MSWQCIYMHAKTLSMSKVPKSCHLAGPLDRHLCTHPHAPKLLPHVPCQTAARPNSVWHASAGRRNRFQRECSASAGAHLARGIPACGRHRQRTNTSLPFRHACAPLPSRLQVAADGTPLRSLHDPTGKTCRSISSATQVGSRLFLGNLGSSWVCSVDLEKLQLAA